MTLCVDELVRVPKITGFWGMLCLVTTRSFSSKLLPRCTYEKVMVLTKFCQFQAQTLHLALFSRPRLPLNSLLCSKLGQILTSLLLGSLRLGLGRMYNTWFSTEFRMSMTRWGETFGYNNHNLAKFLGPQNCKFWGVL